MYIEENRVLLSDVCVWERERERERERLFEFLEQEVRTLVTFEPFQWNTLTIVRWLCLPTKQSIFVRIKNKIDAFQGISYENTL